VLRRSTSVDDLAEQIRPRRPPIETSSRAESLGLLRSGTVDAVLVDLPVALALSKEPNSGLAVAAQLPTDDGFAVALPNRSDNREAIDSAI